MYSNGNRSSVTAKGSVPSSHNSRLDDDESEIIRELEQKRNQLDEEINSFRAQKDREFREFETELRASRRRRGNISPMPTKNGGPQTGSEKPPSRTSSSSALNLLAGRVGNKPAQNMNISKRKNVEDTPLTPTSPKAGVSASQPVVSLEKLNIKGETVISSSGRPRTPPTPTLLSKLPRSSSSSSLSSLSSRTRQQIASTTNKETVSQRSPNEESHRSSFTGLFTPSYISLIDSNSNPSYQSSTALETPPADEDKISTAPASYKSNILNEVLPLSSSSFPPHVTISPGGHSHPSKRSYTAPTISPSRIPSALRTASGSAITRKPKHVTFRLADSAIVEPSSSYEEGPSPQFEDDSSEKSGSGTRSPLRTSKASQLSRTLSPDEEDAEAGVQPGMGMGDVIQRLNDYTIAAAAEDGEELNLEVEDNEDIEDIEDDDDEDVPMEMSAGDDSDQEDDSDRNLTINYHEHEDEDEPQGSKVELDDGYFSPKAKHISTISSMPRGNSPLAPYRDGNWAELSSSDKDRLLFEARRHSDDSDDMRRRTCIKVTTPQFDETGFSGGLRQSIDGGSGVGFFELDEELASPDTGHVRPFTFDEDLEDATKEGEGKRGKKKEKGPSEASDDKEITKEEKKRLSGESAAKFGVGSVPIDIVRPSLSVSSSWVGTFGH